MRKWLMQLRRSKKLTQQQVASCSFIERSYYSQIEAGKRTPSINVANNIAKVLGFNPLQFFKSDLDFSFKEDDETNFCIGTYFQYDIFTYFRNLECGQIVYLYNSIESYNEHVFAYLLAGMQNNRHCVIIDNKANYFQLIKKLETVCIDDEIIKYIHYINIDESDRGVIEGIIYNFQDLKNQLSHTPICIWVHEEKLCQYSMREKLQKIGVSYTKVLCVQSYNASLVSAGEHIKMMKKYPFLMIDGEIVKSPFYKKK